MILEFTVGNYLSFRNDSTLSLVATRLQAKEPALNAGAQTTLGERNVLHGAVLYGANASGKSNFLRAIAFFFQFVHRSASNTQSGDAITVTPFLFHEDSVHEPSYFEVVFVLDGVRYRYGAELDSQRIHREWLYRRKSREVLLFLREGADLTVKPTFSKSALAKEPPRDNALYLSVAAQRNLPLATKLVAWFSGSNFLLGAMGESFGGFTARCLHDQRFSGDLLAFIQAHDLGIRDIAVAFEEWTRENLPRGFPADLGDILIGQPRLDVEMIHAVHDEAGAEVATRAIALDAESAGTRKLFSLAGPLFDTLQRGALIVLDEFDAQLHPMMARALITLFQRRDTNPHGAQLIIATHDTNLLSRELFRRDQIWFVEKTKLGDSDLYSLASFKVRNDRSFETDYIRGRYGAIPFLGGLHAASKMASGGKAAHGNNP